jgi:hypothetical protein
MRLGRLSLLPLLLLVALVAACSSATSTTAGHPALPVVTATATARTAGPSFTATPPPTATSPPATFPAPRPAATDPKLEPYLNAVALQTQVIGDSLNRFRSLASAPNLTDPAWQKQVLTVVALWKVTYTEAQKLDAPACLATSNQTYLASLQSLQTAATDVQQSLTDRSQTELSATLLEVLNATILGQQAATQARSSPC